MADDNGPEAPAVETGTAPTTAAITTPSITSDSVNKFQNAISQWRSKEEESRAFRWQG